MRKSRLSLAAIAALGITTASLSANNLIDIKLPDDKWKFIGVNGGFTEKYVNYDETVIKMPSEYNITITETLDDNQSTRSGVALNTGEMSFLVIDHNSTGSEFTSATMNYQDTSHTYGDSYQTPEMYVYVENNDGNRTPDIRIKYQGDYEGEDFYLTLGEKIYKGHYDSSATYDLAQDLVYYSTTSSTKAILSQGLKDANLTIDYVFDKNMTNNPSYPGFKGVKNDYDYANNHDEINSTSGGTLRIYHYNAFSQSWETYIDVNGTKFSTDFTSLKRGNGYWVKFKAGVTHNDAGLILGDTGITSSDYNESELTAGWNMLSFNDTSLIATGSTGMIVELNVTATTKTVEFTITDTEGTESIDINTSYVLDSADANKTLIVKQINQILGQAQAYGTLSKNFNVRAYSNGLTDHNITLISDKKFRLKDNNGSYSSLGHAWSLGANELYSPTDGIMVVAGSDLNNTKPVESVFGESVLGLKFGENNDTNMSSGAIRYSGTLATDITQFELDGNITNVIGLDTTFDGSTDSILLIDTNTTDNFYISDNLVIDKEFNIIGTSGEIVTLTLNYHDGSTASETVTVSANGGASEIAAALTAITKITASANSLSDGNDTVYVKTTPAYKNFTIDQTSGIQLLKLNSTSTNDTDGAGTVRDVYSLENLARAEIDFTRKVKLDINSTVLSITGGKKAWMEYNITNPAGNVLIIRYGFDNNETGVSSDYNLTSVSGYTLTRDVMLEFNATTTTNQELNISVAMADLNSSTLSATQSAVNAKIFATALNYFLENNETRFAVTATATDSSVYLTGDFNGSTGEANKTTEVNVTITEVSDFNLTITPMVDDLKSNKVYAGSVTTDINSAVPMIQRISKKKVRKILGTNENISTGAISWNFIDLSKTSSDWFDVKDQYNLFSFDKTKGYWVYLEDASSVTSFDNISSSDITLVLQYHHNFTNDTNNTAYAKNYTTQNIISSGDLQVDVSMIDSSKIDRAVAYINGYEVKLTESGNQYTADFSEYELGYLGSADVIDVNVTFFDTDNFSKTISIPIKNTVPTRPTMTLSTAGDLTNVKFASTGATSFYTYSGNAASANLIDSNITTGASSYNLCAAATNFSQNVGAYHVVAVDSDTATSIQYPGDIDYNRASDIGYLDTNYSSVIYPIYKNASILSVSANNSDSISNDFNSSCEPLKTPNASDHAVELTSLNSNAVIIAFEKSVSEFSNTDPSALRTVTLDVNGSDVAKITFDGDHYNSSAQTFLMFFGEKIYSAGWNELNASDGGTAYFTDSNITMMTGQTIAE